MPLDKAFEIRLAIDAAAVDAANGRFFGERLMPISTYARLVLFAALVIAVPSTHADDDRVGFNAHIRPILVKNCVACHGGPEQASGLSLLHRDSALSDTETDSGLAAIVAGDAEGSYLLDRVADPEDETRMPPPEHGPRLTEHEVSLIRRWIEQGAEWQEHWSLEPPQDTLPAASKGSDWGHVPLDRFVLRRLVDKGLKPAPEATRAAWLRRVSFDLLGLPPSEEETAAFLADNRPGAYATVIDRLLASPHYGERWAAVWLDLARYADTKGYEKDPHRDVWPYRDWLIRAFNADMPYDDFTIKQLAGDLLPNATFDDRLATVFHRNTPTNTEGGTDDEEFRIAAVVDRVNTTWQVWQGVTFGCAQCHDHPYDAFTMEDYYNFLAFFNSTRDADLHRDSPNLRTPLDASQYDEGNRIDHEIDQLRREWHAPLATLAAEVEQWRPLAFDRLKSTGQTKLRFDSTRNELHAEGTLTSKSAYDLRGPAPAVNAPITAVRVDVLPKDLEAASKTPEMGFVLTRLRLFVTPPISDGEPKPTEREISFSDIVADEPTPTLDPADTLRDNPRGWGAFSRLWQPRHAVLVLDKPLDLADGSRLRMAWKQERSIDGQGAILIRRAKVSVSTDPRWREIAQSSEAIAKLDRIAELRERRKQIGGVEVPVLVEREAGFERNTYAFVRGNWLAKGELAHRATPASMPALNAETPTRLDLARWIASPDNPLTARTMVNRVWAELFGTGLVETLGDLGASGEPASHPALLDHLAVRFQSEHHWRLKSLLREIVLSATYRQDATVSPELAAQDPRNRLLARGPRQRLTAEMMRDQALVLSGRFSSKMFGKPVMPYQPDGVWRSAYSGAKWKLSEGEDRYRRAIYTYWKRTSGYPSLLAFDTPSREVCSVRRVVTNTPLQALVTMNDPAYFELARGFAEQMQQLATGDPRSQIVWAYETASGRPAADAIIDELVAVYDDARRHSAASLNSEAATDGDSFARTVVANVILNLDEVLTR